MNVDFHEDQDVTAGETAQTIEREGADMWCSMCGKPSKADNCDTCAQWWKDNPPPGSSSRIDWRQIPDGVDRECATDGCGRIAAYEFEAGGVGSSYCIHCTVGIERVLGAKAS